MIVRIERERCERSLHHLIFDEVLLKSRAIHCWSGSWTSYARREGEASSCTRVGEHRRIKWHPLEVASIGLGNLHSHIARSDRSSLLSGGQLTSNCDGQIMSYLHNRGRYGPSVLIRCGSKSRNELVWAHTFSMWVVRFAALSMLDVLLELPTTCSLS